MWWCGHTTCRDSKAKQHTAQHGEGGRATTHQAEAQQRRNPTHRSTAEHSTARQSAQRTAAEHAGWRAGWAPGEARLPDDKLLYQCGKALLRYWLVTVA